MITETHPNEIKHNKAFYSRDIKVEFEEYSDECLLARSHMEDIYHDITMEFIVSRSDMVIRQADVRMVRVPGAHCRDISPAIKQLEGLSITSGFNKKVSMLLKEAGGCPNLLNLIMVSVPLLVNMVSVADYHKGLIDWTGLTEITTRSLDGVCVGYSNKR
jgi:hypothetical protein